MAETIESELKAIFKPEIASIGWVCGRSGLLGPLLIVFVVVSS